MKVLITTPNLSNVGGVSSLYSSLSLNQCDGIDYFCVQSKRKIGSLLRFFELILFYVRFSYKCFSYDVVHVNPSLDKKSFLRDAIFVLIPLLFKRKVLVYWHGWENEFQKTINSTILYQTIFKMTYKRASLHVVLGTIFKRHLLAFGVKSNEIIIESNATTDVFGNNFKYNFFNVKTKLELLFIARLHETKGVLIAIETMKMLNPENYHLAIAGEGPALQKAKTIVKNNNIVNVTFMGKVVGDEKHEVFSNAHVLFFPTFYPEGMPICILEAMMYGLVIISRPVGGVPDWVKDPGNGVLLDSLNPNDFVKAIESLANDKDRINEIMHSNRVKALKTFTLGAFKERLFLYYNKISK